ncbi:MAG: acyl--CoA ligase [Ideonella sp. WA131b]|jgi:acyl-CoA synthetase (AMP-forming)/AMP-acid ligase II|nr:acyl--CoA ligase [Ideonella sp. WA131b]
MTPLDQRTDLPLNLGMTLDVSRGREGLAVIELLADGSLLRRWNYGELDDLINALARGLSARGLVRGDRVGVMGANSVHALAVMLATMRAGLVSVPVNPRAGAETLAYMAEDSALRVVLADADLLPLAMALPGAAGGTLPVLPLQGEAFDALADPGPFTAVVPGEDEVAMVLYTSGSTGRPKGVLLSHRSQVLIAAGYATDFMRQCLDSGPCIVAAPLFHMNATVNTTHIFMLHGAFVLMPRFDATGYIRAISEHRVSVLSGVPTMTAMVAQQRQALAQADFGNVKLVVIGSAPLSATVLSQVQALFPAAAVINSYGTTETGAGYFGAHPQGQPRPFMSVGHAQPHARLRLVDGEGLEVTDAEAAGVLEVHCATRMNGYQNRPELSAEKMRGGWIHTGDIMRRDAEGWYYFVGRADDMFVCSGENVYPGQVERLLERHPDVLEVCVLPLADERRGHIPVAFVVPRPGTTPTEQQLQEHVLALAAPHLHPRRVWFIGQMPLAGTNKIDRKALAQRATELALAPASPGA